MGYFSRKYVRPSYEFGEDGMVKSVQQDVTSTGNAEEQSGDATNKRYWQAPSYVADENEYQKQANAQLDNEGKMLRKQRNAALLSDLANMFVQTSAKKGGAWMIPQMKQSSTEANKNLDRWRERRDNAALVFADRMTRARQAEAEDGREHKKYADAVARDTRDFEFREKQAEEQRKQQEYENTFREKQAEIEKEDREFYRRMKKEALALKKNATVGGGAVNKENERAIYRAYHELIARYPGYKVITLAEDKSPVVNDYPSIEEMLHQLEKFAAEQDTQGMGPYDYISEEVKKEMQKSSGRVKVEY